MEQEQSQSVINLIEKLCHIQVKQIQSKRSENFYSRSFTQGPSPINLEKHLKKVAFQCLLNNKLISEKCKYNLPWHLLSAENWSLQTVLYAIAFRLRVQDRRFEDADSLETKFCFLKKNFDDKYENILRLLLCLSRTHKIDPKYYHSNHHLKVPSREESNNALNKNKNIIHGDYGYYVPQQKYTIYPDWAFKVIDIDRPLMLPPASAVPGKIDPYVTKPYDIKEVKAATQGHGTSIFGFDSEIFSLSGLIKDSYTFESKTSLYGGLSSRKTTSLDVTLSVPDLTTPLDLFSRLSLDSPSSLSEDEGFVSQESSQASTPVSKWKNKSIGKSSTVQEKPFYWVNKLFHKDQPYDGYIPLDYDLNLWKESLNLKKSNHRTWETLTKHAGITKRRLYLTEAGSDVFDAVCHHRRLVVHDFTKFMHRDTSNLKLTVPKRIYINESTLFQHCLLVCIGIQSGTFSYNKLGQMFLPTKNLYFSGVDPASLHCLLSEFAQMGTCYRRLFDFSVLMQKNVQFNWKKLKIENYMEEEINKKGSVYLAFTKAIQSYLHLYHRRILLLKDEYKDGSLLHLLSVLKKTLSQLKYLCLLCKCGSPNSPPPSGGIEFPTGVSLLNYLYDEAVHCHEPHHYLVLLSLLSKSCQPYLQFIQDWVFRGKCAHTVTEFMLRINTEYGAGCKNRMRWKKYIEPVNPNNPESCVPKFLAPLAKDIYSCGKTVALMQLIAPTHFLGIAGVQAPELFITFSKHKLRYVDKQWTDHETIMLELENQTTKVWMDYEEHLITLENEKNRKARISAELHLQNIREEIIKRKKELHQAKQKEFNRLKVQSIEAGERKKKEMQKQKDIDKKQTDDAVLVEEEKRKEQERLLKEAKQAMIEHYEVLNQAAELKIAKANWKKRRRELDMERLKFIVQDKIDIESKLQQPTIENVNLDKQFVDFDQDYSQQTILEDFFQRSTDTSSQNVFEPANKNTLTDEALKLLEDQNKIKDKSNVGNLSSDSVFSILPNMESENANQKRTFGDKKVTDSHLGMDLRSNVNFIEPRLIRKQVDNKNITKTTNSIFSDDKITNYCIAEMNDGESVSEKKNEFDSFVLLQENHEVKNITDSQLGMDMHSNLKLSPKLMRKQVDNKSISETTNSIFGSPVIGEINNKLIGGHVRKATERKTSDSSMDQIFQDSEKVMTPRSGRRPVEGFGVTESSLWGLMVGTSQETDTSTPKYVSTRKLEGVSVSDSTMGNIFSSPEVNCPAIVSSRFVEGVCVSDSTMGDLFSSNNRLKFDPSLVKELPHTAASTVQDILYNKSNNVETINTIPIKKKVYGKEISNSSVSKLLKESKWRTMSEVEIDHLRRFSLQNIGHGGHHSKSTIQDLMYFQKDEQHNSVKKVTLSHPIPKPRFHMQKAGFHPSKSTVQNLMYYTDKPSPNKIKSTSAIEVEFELEILPSTWAEDHLDWLKNISFVQDYTLLAPFDPINQMNDFPFETTLDNTTFGDDWKSDIDIVEMHALPLLLRQCLLRPIAMQVSLVNRCVVNYFMTDLQLPRHFEMIRHFLFFEDGEFGLLFCSQLFERIHGGCLPIEVLNPVVLSLLLHRATQGSKQANSPLVHNLTTGLKFLPSLFGENDPSALSCLTLHYEVGWPCNIVITEKHEAMYNKVFVFFVQLKHVVWALNDVTSRISVIELDSARHDLSESEIRQLHIYRHEMQHFVKVMQGYVSTEVLHVCWSEFQQSLKLVNCLDDLYNAHSAYVHNCLFRCLLTDRASAVMNVITDVMKTILSFRAKLSVKNLSFNNIKRNYENFSKYSNFLFAVVSKLVKRGYQPHLEDFLTRLNFNGYYKE